LNKKELSLPAGVFAASLTPLKNDLSIDFDRLISHCRWLLDNGCNGIVVMGTTGEANSFSVKERMEILDALIEAEIPAHKLLAGTGCCSIPDTIELTKHAVSHNVGGVLMLPPFYYKNMSDEGLHAYFKIIIQQINNPDLKIYLYHIPPVSGVPFSHSLIKKLTSDFPETVIGIKDSSGDWQNMKSLCENFPGFKVYAGTEKYLLDILNIGGAGCISATTNLSCRPASKIFNDPYGNEADSIQKKVNALRSIIEKYPMIPALKLVMAEVSGQVEWTNVRPPQTKLKKADSTKLMEDLKSIYFPDEFV